MWLFGFLCQWQQLWLCVCLWSRHPREKQQGGLACMRLLLFLTTGGWMTRLSQYTNTAKTRISPFPPPNKSAICRDSGAKSLSKMAPQAPSYLLLFTCFLHVSHLACILACIGPQSSRQAKKLAGSTRFSPGRAEEGEPLHAEQSFGISK